MPTGKPPRDAYKKATMAARETSTALRLEALKNLDRALKEYAQGLIRALSRLPATEAGRQTALFQMTSVIAQLRNRLEKRITDAVRGGRDVSFNDVMELQTEAIREVFETQGASAELLTRIQVPRLTMAGQWESLGKGASTWRTLLRGYVKDAADEANMIVTKALLEGMPPDQLAKALRPYVEGAEPFHKAFGGLGEISDKMLNDPAFTGAAGRLRYNADRIAFSEIHNARGEAELQAFAQDPFVESVQWTLSPFRGKHAGPDACDVLSYSDFFGLGPGIYPVAQVPTFPHPFCRCERVPIARPMRDMFTPKPNPPRLDEPRVRRKRAAA